MNSAEAGIITFHKIARICQYIFFALTAIMLVFFAYGVSAGYTEVVSFWQTTLLYFWFGLLVTFLVLYVYVNTNPPVKR